MREATTFTWGIMGTGKMARQFSEDLKLLPDAVLGAVGSRHEGSAKRFADQHDIETHYGSYEEMARDPNVDVVYVATPQSRHAEDAKLALKAGKPVLCEKPLTLNARLSRDLAEMARECDLFLMEAMWTRFLPIFGRITELLDRNVIGEPRLLLADIGAYVPFDPEHRLYDLNLGGGALLDMGIYPIQLAYQLFGDPETVRSTASIGESGVDGQSSYLFQYNDGRQAVLAASTETNGARQAVIAGPKGKLTIKAPWWKGTTCVIENDAGEIETISMPYEGKGYQFEASHVMSCLRNGERESRVMPLRDSVNIASIMDAMRQEWGLSYPDESGS